MNISIWGYFDAGGGDDDGDGDDDDDDDDEEDEDARHKNTAASCLRSQ